MDDERILLIVAARGGSKGVPGKNIRDLCGAPLIAHTIRQAKQWGRASKIVCSTDSSEIADVARRYGALTPFMRPEALATDTAGKLGVLRHALKEMERLDGNVYRVIVDLDATAPIRKVGDLDNALNLFLSERPRCVFSVTPCRKNPYFNMVEVDRAGNAVLSRQSGSPIIRRQDAPKVYDMNASIYVYDRDFLLDERTTTVFSDRSLIYVMDEWSAFDIDNETDFQLVEYLVSQKLVAL